MGAITKEEKEFRKELFKKGLKKCSKCGEILPVENFFKQKNAYDGLNSSCKDCYKKYHIKYYENNQDEIKLKKRKYREEHREEISEYQRKYRELHPNKNKDYYYTHKEELKEIKRAIDKKILCRTSRTYLRICKKLENSKRGYGQRKTQTLL